MPSTRGAATVAVLVTALVAAMGACAVGAPPSSRSAPPSERRVEGAARAPRTRGTPVVRFDGDSPFGRVLVIDQGPHRVLRFGDMYGDDQSLMTLSEPTAVPMDYLRLAAASLWMKPDAGAVLMIGLGGGTFARLAHRVLPEARVTVVEINPVVAQVAREHFGLVEDERLVVLIDDGAAAVERLPAASQDVVLLDAYGADGIPEPLATAAFFERVARLVRPGGLVAINLMAEEPSTDEVLARFGVVFPHLRCAYTADRLNLVALGGRAPLPETAGLVRAAGDPEGWPFDVGPELAAFGDCDGSEGARSVVAPPRGHP